MGDHDPGVAAVASQMSNPGIYSSGQLGALSTQLGAIEDWLRQDCSARHAEDMADVIREAWQITEDLFDDQVERERG